MVELRACGSDYRACRQPRSSFVLSKAELFAGAMKSTDPARTLARQLRFLSQFISLPFDDRAAEAYGRIRTQLETAGAPIGPYDLQIAAIAVSSGLILVTHNTREFGRVPDLALEDWEA
jgi:tRNA(fMet)-specific endonuclease VapC